MAKQTYYRGPRREVDLGPIREAFDRSRMRVNDLARSMELDPEHVRRLLGKRPVIHFDKLASGERIRREHYYRSCNYETGLKFAYALGLDPVDLDL